MEFVSETIIVVITINKQDLEIHRESSITMSLRGAPKGRRGNLQHRSAEFVCTN